MKRMYGNLSITVMLMMPSSYVALRLQPMEDNQGNPTILDTIKDELAMHQICLEDMCAPAVAPTGRGQRFEEIAITPTQSKTLPQPEDTRTLLLQLTFPFHGSTALEGVLMSSDKISTLCYGNRNQCEGKWLMMDHGYRGDSSAWDWSIALDVFSETWNISRPILMDKTPNYIQNIRHTHESIKAAKLPEKFKAEGISTLKLQYILLWRPVCLARLSKHFNQAEDEERELRMFEQSVQAHKYLVQNASVIVVSIADLMWRPTSTALRLQTYLPNVETLDPEFVPQLGTDVFESNRWKADGSVAEFGRSVDPGTIGYSVVDASCREGVSGFVHLNGEQNARAAAAVEYLRLASNP